MLTDAPSVVIGCHAKPRSASAASAAVRTSREAAVDKETLLGWADEFDAAQAGSGYDFPSRFLRQLAKSGMPDSQACDYDEVIAYAAEANKVGMDDMSQFLRQFSSHCWDSPMKESIAEGILDQAYPLSLSILKQKHAKAAAALPSEDGTFQMYGEFILYRPKRGIPLIWGSVPAHRKPIMNNNGEVVKMLDVISKPSDWRHYSEFSPEQKKALGWFPKNERGQGPAKPSAGGRSRGGAKDAPEQSDFAMDPNKEIPRSKVGGTHQLAIAQQAKAMKEPDWSSMSRAEIQKLLPAAISKAKSDPTYQKVVHRMVATMEKNESSELRAFIAEQLQLMAEERTHRTIVIQKGDDGYTIIEPEQGQKLADAAAVKGMGRDRTKWVQFMKQHGVDHIVMKGMGKGGSDNEMPRQKFLNTVIEPPKGQTVPIIKGTPVVKGTPTSPPPEQKVAHAPVAGDVMKDPRRDPDDPKPAVKAPAGASAPQKASLGRIKLAQRRP